MDVAVYVHVPFCRSRCTYCDFNTYVGLVDLRPAYVDAVVAEVTLWRQRYPRLWAKTLYLGGGTPSLLTSAQVARIVAAVPRVPGAEVTLEANPGTVDRPKLQALREAGVNRISLGVQSAHAAELRRLGRIHTWEDAVTAVAAARRAGFDNLSLDLIFGLPGQTLARWTQTLTAVLALAPEHLSLYALKLEPGTPLAEAVAAGDLPAPDPDLGADMYELASERLHAEGFWQYEISNWARGRSAPPTVWALPPAGRTEQIGPWISRHNLVYWRNDPWLGVGAGAHTWLEGRRWRTPLQPQDYVATVRKGTLPLEDVTILSERLTRGETMMMGLRLAEGVTDVRFQRRFGVGLAACYDDVLARFARLGLLTWDDERVRLTPAGRLLGNQVFAAFLP